MEATNKRGSYTRSQPCGDCPYRKDAPLQHWAREEFADLLATDCSEFGAIYGCHKKDGHTCVGWLMNQDERNFPSIALRIDLSRNNVTREYLDSLKSPAGLYASIKEMVLANYPEGV